MKKILLVDDDLQINKVIKEYFDNNNEYEIITAFDGEEGLVKTKEFKPDLILLDIIMPKMDGIAMLKKLKKDEEIKDIPVLMLTNLETKESISQSIKAGSTDYLLKVNYSLEDLKMKIEEILKSSNN